MTLNDLFNTYDKIIYFDTETTGLDAKTCRIIELSMHVTTPSGIGHCYDEFICLPEGEHVPKEITEITHITDEMVQGGIPDYVAAHDLAREVDNRKVLMIAHNCQFDMCFVRELLRSVFGKDKADEIIDSLDWLDSLTVFKDRAEYPHKLCNAIEHYNIKGVANSHRAIDDTIALTNVCFAMDRERHDFNRYINVFGYNPKYGVNGEKLDKITYLPQPYYNGLTPADKILPTRI